MNLYPFQVEAVAKTVKFLQTRGAVYNASDMGLGKTAVTILSISKLATKASKILVVCPAVVCLVWRAEILKWDPERASQYWVISYNKAASEKYRKDLETVDWDFLVVDEAHYLKNLQALRTKAVLKYIWPKAKFKICLSGTPMTQSIMDMYPVISKMAPEDFGNYWEFAKKYTNVVRTPWGPKYKFEGVKNHEKLRAIIKEKFFFRYIKEDVLKDLPGKTYQCIPLGPEFGIKQDEKEQERYLELLKESIVRNLPPPQPPMHIATMLREQGLKKVKAVVDFCENILDSNTPIVVFFQHTSVGDAIETALKKYSPVKIEGSTSEGARKSAIEDFQAGKSLVFLGQIAASGTGITLTRASTVIFSELNFNPSDISQAVSRVDRIGQLNNIMIYYFSVLNSIDEKIQEVLLKKSTAFKKVLAA